MAKKSQKKLRKTFYVVLPEGVDVKGYHEIKLNGRTEASSSREAVTQVLARGKKTLSKKIDFPDNFVALAMGALDNQFGGAEHYAFEYPKIKPVNVVQTGEDLREGFRLTAYEKAIMLEQDFARRLALKNRADVSNPQTRLDYLDKARYLLKEINKIR
jgi:hypothetical protein